MSFEDAHLQLYTFFRSTSTARVRTAAKLKGITLSFIFVNVRKGDQFEEDFIRLNPNRTVPVLTVSTMKDTENKDLNFSIRQSLPILEFFEEAFPDKFPLLPPLTDLSGRSHVRDLVNVIACDIQPPTNRRILISVQDLGGSLEVWAYKIMNEGLLAFEEMVKPLAGKYSYKDYLTLADVVLAPAVENAVRYGVDLKTVPTVKRIFEAISVLDEFKAADWRHQEDTPVEEFRLPK
jgi:maleylacetoacetate isomerase